MIKITAVNPLDNSARIKLQDLEANYALITHSVGHTNPKAIFENSVSVKHLYGLHLTPKRKEIVKDIIRDYETYLLGAPHELESIIRRYKRKGWQKFIYRDGATTEFGNKILQAFGYEDRFRSVQAKGLWLASTLNIKVCPYCNAQYTLVVKKDEGYLGKFQFDHFFPQDKYPYLSLSLYNLIPSCASCNHKKRSREVTLKKHFHPYHNDIAAHSKFKIKYPAKPSELSINKVLAMNLEDIEIRFVPRDAASKNLVDDHNDLYDIDYIYQRHVDIAHQILVHAILHNVHYQKLVSSLRSVFPDRTTLMRYLLGHYLKKEEINKQPLSKMVQDLARQLQLI